MKVAFFIFHQLSGKGGIERVLSDVATSLLEHQVNSEIYTILPIPSEDSLISPIPIHSGSIPKFLDHKHLLRPRALAEWHKKNEIKKLLKKASQNCDVLVLVGLELLSNIKDFNRVIDCLKTFKEKNPSIPMFSWAHFTLHFVLQNYGTQFSRLLDMCDAHLAISEGLASQIRNNSKQKNIYTIYNPVNSAPIVKRNPKKIIFVGRVAQQKQVIEFINNVLCKLRGDWSFDIIGEPWGPFIAEDLLAAIANHGLSSRIQIHGWKKEPWKSVDEAGVLILNSEYEGFGLVLVEAMMRGIPCISTNCPVGPSDIIKEGINGWLYNINDYERCLFLLQSVIDETMCLPSQAQIVSSVDKFLTKTVINNFQSSLKYEVNKRQKNAKSS